MSKRDILKIRPLRKRIRRRMVPVETSPAPRASAVYANVGRHHLSGGAAGVAFFGILAIFPALAALVGLYGLIADPTAVMANLDETRRLLPADAYGLIESQLQALLDVPNQRLGVAFVVAMLLALWSARAGVSTQKRREFLAQQSNGERV
jgi:uncharacterized BrkB/YihY/UPF0761 family membrane protein